MSRAAEELSLKFLFANQDGVSVVLRFPRRALVADVKAQLLRHWPPSVFSLLGNWGKMAVEMITILTWTEVAAVDDSRAVRLICMGRGMLQDGQTLEAARVPSFPTHPTPVNVSVRRSLPPANGACLPGFR